MKKILLYTGPIKTGKSARLLAFVQNKKDIGGILSPVFEGKKFLYDIRSGDKKLLEAEITDMEQDIINVGKYKFKRKVFDWGKEILVKESNANNSLLIIDEVGPLEFSCEGLSPAASEIIKNYSTSLSQIIVVVRESLINKFCKYYRLDKTEVDFISFP